MDTTSTTPVPLGEDAPILEVMATMRAMRRLKPDPVPDALLERVVEAATWAPSASNVQAYNFVVVTDREQIARLADPWGACVAFYLSTVVTPDGVSEEKYDRMKDALRHQRDHFKEIPALILACYDYSAWERRMAMKLTNTLPAMRRLGWRRGVTLVRGSQRIAAMGEAASIYPAVQNLLLAARANGLGAVMTTWHMMLEPEFKQILDIPRSVKVFSIVPVGWPTGNFGPVVRRPATEVIHRNRWGAR
jgi:nitroreductase